MVGCKMERWLFVITFALSFYTASVKSLKVIQDLKRMKLQFRASPEDFDLEENYRIFVNRSQEIINSTITSNGHHREIAVTVVAFGEIFVLDLKLNTFLFSSTYMQKSISSTGEIYHSVNQTEDHCHYLGKVRGRDPSSAAVSTCNGIIGYFTVGNLSYHIEPQSGHLTGLHKVYRSRKGAKAKYSCGSHGEKLRFLNWNILQKHTRVKRAFLWPQDGDKREKVIELYVANDYNQYLDFSGNTQEVFGRTKVIVNIASSVYQPLGIYLVLVGVEVWTSGNLITVDRNDSMATLQNWYSYRRTNINPLHYNDNGILITTFIFPGSVIGKAELESMCSFNASGAIISDVLAGPALAGITMAHEIGHTFGLIHDADSCSCDEPEGRNCIMHYQTDASYPATHWSQCSKDQLATAFQHGLDICLYDIPQTIFQSSPATCGNGIVEDGEQCDCGNATREVCNRDCCDWRMCLLIPPARCASGRCCDVATCQVKPQWTECRTKNSDCDLTEFCDGVNSRCPDDTYKPDGTDCTRMGAAYCYQGLCRSHRSQCELLWGPSTIVSNDYCYLFSNTRGDFYGNCGMNWLRSPPGIECQQSNVQCGRLQCEDKTKLPYFYLNYYALSSSTVGTYSCHAAIFDYGLRTQDPGLVPNGAKCGDGLMCVNQTCVSVSNILQSSCSPSCQPNEVCNNFRQCQKISPDPSTTTDSTTTTPTTFTTTTPTTTTTTPTTIPITTTSVPTTPTTSTTTTTPTTPNTPTLTPSSTSAVTIPIASATTVSSGQGEGASGAYLGSSRTGVNSPLRLEGNLANRMSRFNISTNSFRTRLTTPSQFLYTEICAGILASTTAQLKTTGAFPPLNFDWMSTAQNEVDSGCRGGVLSVTRIIAIFISQNGGGVYSSSNQKETSWSVFSITDTMKYASQLLCVYGASSSSMYGALPSLNPLVNPTSPVRLYNAATTAYRCASDAPAYFFSMSVGVSAGRTASVQLVINGIDHTFEMTRQNTRTTGVTTLARTVLVPCTGDARMLLTDGEVVPESNLISFTAFPYELKEGTSVTWAGYRTRDVTNPGTITYDLWLVRKEINFQVENSVIQIPIRGYYYVYVSAGVGQEKPLSLTVTVNGNSLFGLTRTATDHNGVDTIGHGMVVLLYPNDKLGVEASTTTVSLTTGLHTSFIGMLLYQE